MALAGKLTSELWIQTPAAKFFNLFTKQLHQLQNVTESVHHGKIHQGDDWHSKDSVKQWSITVEGKIITLKEKFESIDEQNKSLTVSLFDGEIGQHYKIFKLSLQVIDKDDGGAITKWTIEYEKVNEDIAPPHGFLDYVTKVTKDVDAYLLNA